MLQALALEHMQYLVHQIDLCKQSTFHLLDRIYHIMVEQENKYFDGYKTDHHKLCIYYFVNLPLNSWVF